MITDTYKEMCKQAAKDLEELWEPKYGNRVLYQGEIEYLDERDLKHSPHLNFGKNVFCVFYQEQLQDMVSFIFKLHTVIVTKLGITGEGFIMHISLHPSFSGNSTNELWMQLVMYKKFHKIWDFDKKNWIGDKR